MELRRTTAAGTLLLALLAGCGTDEAAAPPGVSVAVGGQEVDLRPTQYCQDGDGQRYGDVVPPIIEVAPDARITLTVPDDVAEQGWAVQVFDEQLQEKLGEVAVDEGEAVFDEITSSDVVPAAFYLVVVEDKGGPCGAFSGAWPVGFIRAGGEAAGSTSAPAG
ncbi:DUF2771 family protein [Geodermatophilus sp. SYSU D00691]